MCQQQGYAFGHVSLCMYVCVCVYVYIYIYIYICGQKNGLFGVLPPENLLLM